MVGDFVTAAGVRRASPRQQLTRNKSVVFAHGRPRALTETPIFAPTPITGREGGHCSTVLPGIKSNGRTGLSEPGSRGWDT